MSKLLTEFVGTFFLVLTVGLAVLQSLALAPLIIGSSLMIMVYMGGHISGAHYNPAVSLAIYLRGKIATGDLISYWVSQLLGAISAALVVWVILRMSFAPAPAKSASIVAVLLIEILFTFALALVVLNVAATKATDGNSFYGLAIGFTVAVGAAAAGGISGGAFNPAVGVGPALVQLVMGTGSVTNILYYIIGPMLGAVLAAFAYGIQQGKD